MGIQVGGSAIESDWNVGSSYRAVAELTGSYSGLLIHVLT